MARTNGLTITPVAGALGAEVGGVDLSRPLDEATAAALRAALVDHLVLMFRDQDLDPDAQTAFTATFGAPMRLPYIAPMDGHPEVIAVLKEADERNISTFGGTWHSDFSFLGAPPLGSVLYAVEVPPAGGDTIWANMYGAYESLSAGLRALLDGMTAMHSGHVYGAERPPVDIATSTSIAISRNNPEADREVAHPVVRRHPESGRKALFVNPVYTTRFADMTEAESAPLLEMLYEHATRPEHTCRLGWQAGSLAVWDNRCTLHLAVNDYDGHRRLLHRTAIAGERPLAAGSEDEASPAGETSPAGDASPGGEASPGAR